jgi:F-type H+-transporting ATPase subunit delta
MEEIAQVYARALFDAAKERGELDEIREELATFADAVEGSHDLQVFLFSPYLSTDEKKDGLRRAVEDSRESFMNFLELLVENHRMPAIFRIRRQYEDLWEHENHLLPVEVTSAVELDEATVQQIGNTIGEQTGEQIELSSRVDPDILGGIVVRVGNSILDASIRNRLEQLRKQVAKAA